MTDSTTDPWTRQAPGDEPPASAPPVDQSFARSPRWPSLDRLPGEPPVKWDTGLSDQPWPGSRRRAGGPPPRPSGAPPEDRTRWLIGLGVLCAALLIILVVLAGYLFGQRNQDAAAPSTTTTAPTTPTTTAPPSSTTTTDPSAPSTTAPDPTTTPTAPPTTIDPTRVNDEVQKLELFVQQTRGLEYQQPVNVTVLDEQSFKDRLGAIVDAQQDQLEAQGNGLKTLGLIPPDADYFQQYRTTFTENVDGLYDVKKKELLVKGNEINDHVRSVLVHELTHALDDQHFNLDRDDQYKDAKNEIAFGFQVLSEGDATRVANEYVKTLPAGEQAAELEGQPGGPLPGFGQATTADPIAQSLAAPYPYGLALVNDILANGGQAQLDKDFGDPPTTSEQAMHPDKYRAREPALDVALPPTPDPTIKGNDLGMVGEFRTGQLLASSGDKDAALKAADGWGGDHAYRLQRPGQGRAVHPDRLQDGHPGRLHRSADGVHRVGQGGR